MNEVNLADAFLSYKVKSAPRARCAVTADRELVLTCSYKLFQGGDSKVLRYEESLAEDAGVAATALRAHLAEAVRDDLGIRLIIALPLQIPASLDVHATPRPARTSFHVRKDLVGRVTFFDGQRFVLEFRKKAEAA